MDEHLIVKGYRGPSTPAMWCLALICLALAACGGKKVDVESAPAPLAKPDWRTTITDADMNRLQDWRSAFIKALEKAKASGHGPSLSREGALLDPDAKLPAALPSPGTYKCRVIKLGGKGVLMGDYVVYPPAPCRIDDEGGVFGFSMPSGNQRPVGLLFPMEDSRMIFLGTLIIGDEVRALDYGRDSNRDMVGAFERIGPMRWRLILPKPKFESMLDVIEVIPAK
jgi:hypothetical protein